MRLRRIDELVLDQYVYLAPGDDCFYLRTYTAGAGFRHSDTNDLISNFKKPPTLRKRTQWRHKERAIEELAMELRDALGDTRLERNTYVPVPPSKAPSDPEYDDRIVRLLQIATRGLQSDLRQLVVQTRSSRSSHHQDSARLRPDEIREFYEIDESQARPEPIRMVVVDDLLTTGAHFVAMREVLTARFPRSRVFGVFLARTAHRRGG